MNTELPLHATERMRIVKRFIAYRKRVWRAGRRLNEADDIFALVPKSTLYRWERLYWTHGPKGLIDGRAARSRRYGHPGRPLIQPPAEAWAYFNKRLFAGRSVRGAWELTERAARRKRWPWPSLRTVQQRVKDGMNGAAFVAPTLGHRSPFDKSFRTAPQPRKFFLESSDF